MSKLYIDNITPIEEHNLYQGVFIVVLNVGQTPPHIELIVNGNVFSLDAKGLRVGEPLSTLLKLIELKGLRCLFIKLENPKFYSALDLQGIARKVFKKYSTVEVGGDTCLSPINEFCSETYNINANKVHFVFDLIPLLVEHSIIELKHHLNLENQLVNGKLSFEKYKLEDIYNHTGEIQKSIPV